MIATVVVTHGLIGIEMVRVAQSIVKESAPMVGVSLEHDESVEVMTRRIKGAIKQVDQGDGVLLLVDLFGGTPSNLCLTLLEEGKVEVIAGVNLPMIIKLASLKEVQALSEVTQFIKSYGQKNIAPAGEILKK